MRKPGSGTAETRFVSAAAWSATFVLPKGSSFDDLYRQRNADNIGEQSTRRSTPSGANKAKIGDAFADVMFNSETKLGDTRNRNRRLKTLIEDFAKLDLRPSVASDGKDHGRPGRHRQRLYLPDRALRLRGRQEGRRVLHARQVSRVLAALAPQSPATGSATPPAAPARLLIGAGRR